MKLYEQIDHALDVKARIQDYMVELDNMEGYVAPSDVVNRLNSIFNKADKADRAGKSDKTTVATFYASKIFFDVRHCTLFILLVFQCLKNKQTAF